MSCLHYTHTEGFYRDTGHSYVLFQAKEDESTSHLLNTRYFASSSQEGRMNLKRNNKFSSHPYSNDTVAQCLSEALQIEEGVSEQTNHILTLSI